MAPCVIIGASAPQKYFAQTTRWSAFSVTNASHSEVSQLAGKFALRQCSSFDLRTAKLLKAGLVRDDLGTLEQPTRL
jgi:hypothetical protein